MSLINEALVGEDEGLLVELVYGLDLALSLIAYDGKNKDVEFIKREQREIKEKYSDMVRDISKGLDLIENYSRVGVVLSRICYAYDFFQSIGFGIEYSDAEGVEEEAEGILQTYLLQFPEEDFE